MKTIKVWILEQVKSSVYIGIFLLIVSAVGVYNGMTFDNAHAQESKKELNHLMYNHGRVFKELSQKAPHSNDFFQAYTYNIDPSSIQSNFLSTEKFISTFQKHEYQNLDAFILLKKIQTLASEQLFHYNKTSLLYNQKLTRFPHRYFADFFKFSPLPIIDISKSKTRQELSVLLLQGDV